MRTRLKALRIACGFSQYTFADALGISRSHYSQIEAGGKTPSLPIARKIKETVGYTDDDIFDNDTTCFSKHGAPKRFKK
ncbi:MAG: helix-turn-helix transcriptional regulator [Eubacterium sp.]|nr:helix-turn-helix transcriptional regulator [Eubacterium sp.]